MVQLSSLEDRTNRVSRQAKPNHKEVKAFSEVKKVA